MRRIATATFGNDPAKKVMQVAAKLQKIAFGTAVGFGAWICLPTPADMAFEKTATEAISRI